MILNANSALGKVLRSPRPSHGQICIFIQICVHPESLLVLTVTEVKVKVLVAQLCLTLRDPMDCSPPGSFVHGILHAVILEWVAFPLSRDLPNPGIKPRSPARQADALPSEPPGKPLLAFALLHFVLQSQMMLLQVSLDFLLLNSSPV